MDSITINVPTNLHLEPFEVEMIEASRLFQEGRLSSGQAAEMVGISERTFIEILGKYKVSVFGYSYEDIDGDLNNA